MVDAKKVFIIDDDQVILTSLIKLLNNSGFQAGGITDPSIALATIKSFKPDVILLDLLMPKIGGFEVCDSLNKDIFARSIPVIVVSALGNIGDIKEAYKLGVDGYVTKPYEFSELLEVINKTLINKEK